VVVRKFLENFSPNEIVLIGRPVKKTEMISGYKFSYPIYKIPTPPVGTRGEKIWQLLSTFLGVFVGLSAIHKHKPNAILAFYRDESSLMTGYILHKITKIPLYSYFCDLYLENFQTGLYNKLALWLQHQIFKCSSRVFALTEAIQDYYKVNYSINTTVLPHCVNFSLSHEEYSSKLSNPLRIGYLGNVNMDRIPSLKMLSDAINGDYSFELTYFTVASEKTLRIENLLIPNSKIFFVSNDEILLSELKKCDILYLPVWLPFTQNGRSEQAKTGFPTKTLEYLLCRKPILLHSYVDYFVAIFCERYKCCYLVDGGLEEIKEALLRLRSDETLRANLSINTSHALSYFNGSVIANIFRKELWKIELLP
jgi:hypothetical protein